MVASEAPSAPAGHLQPSPKAPPWPCFQQRAEARLVCVGHDGTPQVEGVHELWERERRRGGRT